MNRYFLKHEVLGLRAFTAASVQTPYGTPGDTCHAMALTLTCCRRQRKIVGRIYIYIGFFFFLHVK